jgi:hypothetical protein
VPLQPAVQQLAIANGWLPGRLHLLALFCVALAVRLVAIALVQPRLGDDGRGYLAGARAVVEHGPDALAALPIEHAPLYSVFLAVGLLLPNVDITWFAAVSQSIIGAATAVVLARLTARETHSVSAGVCAGAIAAVHISFVFWTAYVLSDTLFLLLVAVCADRVLALRNSKHPGLDAGLLGCLALLSIAARPTGIVYCVALLPLIVIAARRSARRMALLLAAFCLPAVLLVIMGTVGGYAAHSDLPMAVPGRVADWARSGVENGLLWTESGRATSGVDLDVSPPPIVNSLPPDQRNEFLQVGPLGFAAHHPEFLLQQEFRKLRTFWAPALPEYSWIHAVVASAYFVSLYGLAIVGLAQIRRPTPMVTLASLTIVLFTLTSLITFVDYDQRYRLPVELFLVPLAGVGLAALLEFGMVRVADRKSQVEATRARPVHP